MQLSTITYDRIRTKSIVGIGGVIQLEGLGQGVIVSDKGYLYTIAPSKDDILIGTDSGISTISILPTDSISVFIADSIRLSLNPAREEHLSYITSPIMDSHLPYSTFIVEGIGESIAILVLTPWTSYRIVAESISDIGDSLVRISSEWLIRYTDTIDISHIHSSRYNMGGDTRPIISMVPLDGRIGMRADINSLWTSKISIMRARTLNIV